jgi:hypothetical protein
MVDLGFGSTSRTPIGFRCRDDTGRYLAVRAVEERTLRFALLIDFIRLTGLPSCRPGEIAAFCEESGACAPLSSPARVCIPLEQTLLLGDEPLIAAIGSLLRGLDGTLITEDAPRGPVIVRAVATAQTCAELEGDAPVDLERVIGCAVSCPVQLDAIDGEVILDLPTLSDRCAAGVMACAAGSLAP